MKKIILLIICTCILSSCRLNEERKAVPEDKEELRYAVRFYGGRDEHYANSTLHLYIVPSSVEWNDEYQVNSYTIERLENNQWIQVDERSSGFDTSAGLGWRFIDQDLAPYVIKTETSLRLKIHISDKSGEVEVYSPDLKLYNEIAVAEKMDSAEFLSLDPYSLYNKDGKFVQDESVTAENAVVLVRAEACKVIGEVNFGHIKNSVTCQVIDNDACPISYYRDYLPEDDVNLKARKMSYYYDDGPLYDKDFITGKEFKELLAEYDKNKSISIPVCLIEGEVETEERLNSHGYRFYDENNDIYYELSQSTMYPGVYFTITKDAELIAHTFLYTDKKLLGR